MINGEHDTIDHEFCLNGVMFNKLFYLVDGIYPSLSRFLGQEIDPATKLDGAFKMVQESSRKDVERGYGVLKIKFLALTHPIRLHHRDDIYYVVLACILLHNMMVEERVKEDEMEDSSFYNRVFDEYENGSEYEEDDEVGGYDQNLMDRRDKSTIAHRRWEELYDYEGSKKLRDAMKRHLYKEKYGESALDAAHLWMDGYNPLSL
jgi:hypothetical protein